MAIDDTALLRLQVEVREGLAKVAEFEARYKQAVTDLSAATRAGLDPASEDYQKLIERVRETGSEVVDAAEKGRDGLVTLATATGKPVKGLEDLNGKIIVTRAELRGFRQGAVEAAGGTTLLADSAERASARLKSFATGIVVGTLLNELKPALIDAAKGAGDLFGTLAAGGDTVAKLGPGIHSLGANLETLEKRELALRTAEAEGIITRTGVRLSVEEVIAAQRKHEDALASIEEKYQRDKAAATSSADLLDARADKMRATTAAEHEYADAISNRVAILAREVEQGKAFAAEQQKEIDAQHAARDAIEGNVEAIGDQAEALQRTLPELAEHGRLTRETFANAKELIQGSLDSYEKYGLEVPEWLQKVSKQFGILTSAQQEFRDQISGNSGDLAKQADDLVVAYTAARDYGEINRASFENAKEVVQEALDRYASFGKEVPPNLAAVAASLGVLTSAQQGLRDSILGNSTAIVDQTKNLELVVAAIEKEGAVSPPIQDNIREKVLALTKQYEDFGQKVPASLQAIINKYGELSTAQAGTSLADVFAGGDAKQKKSDLEGQRKEIERTVEALEEQAAAGTTSAAQDEALWAAKNELANVTRDLNNVTTDLAASTANAASETAGLRTDVAEAVDGMGRYAETSQSTAEALGDVADQKGPVAEAFREIGAALKETSEETVGGASAIDEVYAHLADSTLPKVKKMLEEIRDVQGGVVGALN